MKKIKIKLKLESKLKSKSETKSKSKLKKIKNFSLKKPSLSQAKALQISSFSAHSLIEIMVSVVVISILMAAFVPLMLKKNKKNVVTSYIKQDAECASLINSSCYLCDTRKKICLGCELSCIGSKTLNYNKCKCE